MKAKHKITQQDISAALHRFLNQGGHIDHLPDQQYKASSMVGEEKYDAYESIANLSKLASGADKTPS